MQRILTALSSQVARKIDAGGQAGDTHDQSMEDSFPVSDPPGASGIVGRGTWLFAPIGNAGANS
jgi:hypothetical protein